MRKKDQHKKLRLGVMRNYQKDHSAVLRADGGYKTRMTKSMPILDGHREDWMSWLNTMLRIGEF